MPFPSERILSGSSLPHRLADLPNPPRVLYLRGELPAGPAVAVVGARSPTDPALSYAHRLGAELARAGVAVLSGGAKGIDREAHEGALAAGGVTVVVAPSSFDRPSPKDHGELFDRIVAGGGAHLSAEPPGTVAQYHLYFRRNALLAALCHALIVVEAPLRSGARNAAAHARRLGRPLFVVPSPSWNAKGHGCIVELQRGARALLSVRDVLRLFEQVGIHAIARAPAQQLALPLGASPPDRILEAVAAGAGDADAICVRTGLPAAEVQRQILTLTLSGVLITGPSGRLLRVGSDCNESAQHPAPQPGSRHHRRGGARRV